MKNIPLFCINLDRAKERKEKIVENWINKNNFNITFFNAFDKKDLTGSYVYHYDPKVPESKINRPLTLGEIACLTSFCLLSEKILSSDLEEVIFLEDDVFPFLNKESFFEIIEEGKKEFPEADALMLTKNADWNNNGNIEKKYFSLAKNHLWGNHLFYINKNGIKTFYENIAKMQYPADFVWDEIFIPNEKLAICNEPLAYHEGTTTYIGNEYRKIIRQYIN